MEEWYQTIWGILLLGALGSFLGALLLKITSILINKLGINLLLRISSNLLIPYAENKHYVKLCEENQKPYLIPMRYNMTVNKYSRVQIIFVCTFVLSFVMWSAYFSSAQMTIFIPIFFTLMTVKDLYDFVKWYFAISGAFPSDMKKYQKQIDELKKKDKITFLKAVIEKNDS